MTTEEGYIPRTFQIQTLWSRDSEAVWNDELILSRSIYAPEPRRLIERHN